MQAAVFEHFGEPLTLLPPEGSGLAEVAITRLLRRSHVAEGGEFPGAGGVSSEELRLPLREEDLPDGWSRDWRIRDERGQLYVIRDVEPDKNLAILVLAVAA